MDIQSLTFPHAAPPAPGEITRIAPGVLWFRLKLPFQLNHVNIYLIEDDDGWLALDTGLGTDDCRVGWDSILTGPLKGERLSGMQMTGALVAIAAAILLSLEGPPKAKA